MIRWNGVDTTIDQLAAGIEALRIPGQPMLSPSPSLPFLQNNCRNGHTAFDVLTPANGGQSVGERVGNGSMLSTVVTTTPQGLSTVPAVREPPGAGCPSCVASWDDLRPGDACPSCRGVLLGSCLAYAIAEHRGYV